ncbi:MAG TPA: hypothetical protein VF209_03535 [Patescibacteria group bacterium]
MLDYLKRLVFNWHFFNLLIITFLALLGSLPFFHSGLYTAHDIWHQVARHYHYSQALTQGQLFPAWISTLANGYGYPLFVFSYHLPWMCGSLLTTAGASVFTSIKALFVITFLLSGYSMYFFTTRFLNSPLAGLLAAIIYMWAPYHFLTNYVSAAIGTAFIFTLLPLVFLGAHLLLSKPQRGIGYMALGLAGIILSHLISFALLLPFVILFFSGLLAISFVIDRKVPILLRRGASFMGAVGLSIFLSAFYLLPLLKFLPLIQATTSEAGFAQIYVSNFVAFKQLVYSPWGFGPIISNAKDGEISFQVGIAQWVALELSGILVVSYWLRSFWSANFWLNSPFFKKEAGLAKGGLTVFSFAVSAFLMLDYSQPLWDFGNTLVALDYPFRLLVVSVFFGSLIAGWVMKALRVPLIKYPLAACLILIALYTNRNHVRVNQYTEVPLDLYVRSEKTTNTFHEYLPSQADSSLLNEENTAAVLPETIDAEMISQTTTETVFAFSLAEATMVSFHQFAFPGQTLYLDDQLIEYTTDGQGLISAMVEPGAHQAVVRYQKPIIFTVALIVSGVSLLAVLFLLLNKTYAK